MFSANPTVMLTLIMHYLVIKCVSDKKNIDMYIGSGKLLSFDDYILQAKENSNSAYKKF
jgi:hypothetical protein